MGRRTTFMADSLLCRSLVAHLGRTELEATNAASKLSLCYLSFICTWQWSTARRSNGSRLHPLMTTKGSAGRRSSLRRFIERIEIPAGDGKLMVFGDLGRMLATAAGERDGSMLAAVVECGCGGSKPTLYSGVA